MQIGDKVGRYRLERPLGEGGMGAVFLAYDPQTESRVVLKLLPADLTSPEMEARFRREIKSIAQIDHPNAVRVLDYTVSKEACFYTMPHIPAMDLSRYVKILQGPETAPPASSFPRLQAILVGVARALAHCHQRELYHRDIKPENILVETKEHAGILADFGLARSANLTNITRTSQMLGTLRYMSPELMHGSEVGAESDIYQIGLVAFEIFTGQLPLEADSPQQSALRRMSEEIPSPRTFNPVISVDLANLILWSLIADPAQRPPTMETWADALEGLDPVDAVAAAARVAAPASRVSSPGIVPRSVSIPNISRVDAATVVGEVPSPAPARSASDPRTAPMRSASQSGARQPFNPSLPPVPVGEAPRSRIGRSGPNLGPARARITTSTERLSISKQLSQNMIAAELKRRDRLRKLPWVVLATAVVAGLGFYAWSSTPHGFEIRPGFQDAAVIARGPAFRLELSEKGALRSTVEPRQETDGSWRATLDGLRQGQEYQLAWVTASGRRGGPTAFSTREVKVTDVTHQLKDGGVELAFKSSLPVRAVAVLRGSAPSVQLDAQLATEHQGTLPMARMRATELVVELTDSSGARARVPIGEITSPLALARRLEVVVGQVDMDKAFMRIHGSVRGVPRVGQMLADDFRQGPYRDVIKALDEFRPAGAAYFDDPDVKVSARARMYDTLTKLTMLSALLAVEGIPLEFPAEPLLGSTFAVSLEDQLPGAEPIRLMLPTGQNKLRRDMGREIRGAGKAVGDAAESLGWKKEKEDHLFTVKLADVPRIARAQLTLRVRSLKPLTFATTEVNGRMKLFFHTPGHRAIGSTRAVLIHHAFDPRLLKEGENQLHLRVGYLSKLEFAPMEAEGLELKVERRPAELR